MNIDNLLNNLIEAAKELCELVDNENDMLMKADPKMDDGHLKQKDLLARAYEGHVREIDEFKDEAKNAPEELRNKAKASADKLKESIALNVVRIRARYEANMMLLESYSKAVSDVNSETISYSDDGKIRNSTGPNAGSSARPTTLSQTL